ncbi:MAG TPA: hypothetical protein VGH21_03580 [Solirubrobacteraceae bacterium]
MDVSAAKELRDQARMRAQREMEALRHLIDDSAVCAEEKDAMRARLRNLWTQASLAMTLIDAVAAKGGTSG